MTAPNDRSFGAPHGLPGIIAAFGHACQPACRSGLVALPAPLGGADGPERFCCHEALAATFAAVFRQIYESGHWETLRSFGGCYACRKVRGRQALSTHAWGIAVDLNAAENPLGAAPPAAFSPTAPFVFAADHPVVQIFRAHGFLWGGEFTRRKDAMHFQFATGW